VDSGEFERVGALVDLVELPMTEPERHDLILRYLELRAAVKSLRSLVGDQDMPVACAEPEARRSRQR
jgi:hypothetical protein